MALACSCRRSHRSSAQAAASSGSTTHRACSTHRGSAFEILKGLFSTQDHLGFALISAIPAAIQFRLGHALSRSGEGLMILPGIVLSQASVLSIALVYAIARRAGRDRVEALIAAALMASAATMFYYSRHLLPYDSSLLLALVAAFVITSLVLAAAGDPVLDVWDEILSVPEGRNVANIINNASVLYLSGLAAAMQLIEFGAPFEMLVVPSIGSSAISNGGEPGTQGPSCSPLKMPGASSLIPSPITTSPQMFIRSNMPRMASQAAASAASLSPRPSQRNEFSAAASVARTKSNSMTRSMS